MISGALLIASLWVLSPFLLALTWATMIVVAAGVLVAWLVFGRRPIPAQAPAGNAITVATSLTPSFTSVTTSDTAGNTTVTSGSGVTITPTSGNAVSLTTAGLANGGNQLTGVASGLGSSTLASASGSTRMAAPLPASPSK